VILLKRFLLCLVLVFLIFSSGCLGGSDTETHKAQGEGRTKGIEIIEFSAPAKVESGETVEINLYLQNIGANLGEIVTSDETVAAISLYQSSGFSGNKEFQASGSPTLNPPEKEYNIAGDIFTGYWTLTAPEVVKDQTRSLFCKVHYSYKSKASTNVVLVSKSMWDSEGGASSFKTYSTSTEGPVTLEIIPVPAIKISDPDTVRKKVPIDIILKNTGSGVISDNYVYDFEMSIKSGDVTYTYNNDRSALGHITCASVEDTHDDNRVRIFGVEQERSFRCDLKLDFDQAKGSVGYIIEAGLKYNYAVDSAPLNILIEKK